MIIIHQINSIFIDANMFWQYLGKFLKNTPTNFIYLLKINSFSIIKKVF